MWLCCAVLCCAVLYCTSVNANHGRSVHRSCRLFCNPPAFMCACMQVFYVWRYGGRPPVTLGKNGIVALVDAATRAVVPPVGDAVKSLVLQKGGFVLTNAQPECRLFSNLSVAGSETLNSPSQRKRLGALMHACMHTCMHACMPASVRMRARAPIQSFFPPARLSVRMYIRVCVRSCTFAHT